MFLLSGEGLVKYIGDDRLWEFFKDNALEHEKALTCQQWLIDSAAKRYATSSVYGDLLESSGRRILDVGGGLTTIQRALSENHDYTLVDVLAHDDKEDIQAFFGAAPNIAVRKHDWLDVEPTGAFDVVIANDLFPNVDQRVEAFIEHFLPISGEIRLTLTVYNNFRYYQTRRVNGDEILYLLAWNGDMLRPVIERYADRIDGFSASVFNMNTDSIFPNGRHVIVVTIKGDHAG